MVCSHQQMISYGEEACISVGSSHLCSPTNRTTNPEILRRRFNTNESKKKQRKKDRGGGKEESGEDLIPFVLTKNSWASCSKEREVNS